MKKKYLMCSYWLVVSLLITLSWCVTSCKDDGNAKLWWNTRLFHQRLDMLYRVVTGSIELKNIQ